MCFLSVSGWNGNHNVEACKTVYEGYTKRQVVATQCGHKTQWQYYLLHVRWRILVKIFVTEIEVLDHFYWRHLLSGIYWYPPLILHWHRGWHSINPPLASWSHLVDTLPTTSTDCWSSVDRLLANYQSGCWLRVSIKGVDQHSTMDTLSTHNPIFLQQ